MTLGQLMSLVDVTAKADGAAKPQATPGSVADLAMFATMRTG